MKKLQYNWEKIQEFYDNNHTWKEVREFFGVCNQSISKAIKYGKLKVRNKSDASKLHYKLYGAPKMTEEAKKRLSKYRIDYLMKHPDKVPYKLNHSSKKSWPEQIFENALISSNINGWEYGYQNSIYEYDFAWPSKKIDVEIDGRTHILDKVKCIDKRRDIFSKSLGWKVIRFPASRIKLDINGCINELKRVLYENKIS